MSELVIPDHTSRNPEADLRVLARRVLTDLVDFGDKLTPHIVENKDLLSWYVANALGAMHKINWGTASAEEVARMAVWQDYCCDLFDQVKPFILRNLGDNP